MQSMVRPLAVDTVGAYRNDNFIYFYAANDHCLTLVQKALRSIRHQSQQTDL
jgi:hypothetical protein